MFPISRDPPEGGTEVHMFTPEQFLSSFQFLGIPPKGELTPTTTLLEFTSSFQFLGIPPKGEQSPNSQSKSPRKTGFQFLGIPPKGERTQGAIGVLAPLVLGFQFLGIPPKGELHPY